LTLFNSFYCRLLLLEVPLKLLFALLGGSNYCRRSLVFDRRLAQN
jgi:hypothetical protein